MRLLPAGYGALPTGDPEAPQQAIEAFQKLVRTYPNSQICTTRPLLVRALLRLYQ